jgi:hypothetical protein
MDEATFWGLIDASRAQAADEGAGQEEVLADMLAELGSKEIVAFDATFRRLHAAAFTWDLWAAAYIIEGGCSDDGFTDFRSGLIGLGRKVYEDAIRDPATLVSQPATGVDFTNESMMYAAMGAYERVAGVELPIGKYQAAEPAGER